MGKIPNLEESEVIKVWFQTALFEIMKKSNSK